MKSIWIRSLDLDSKDFFKNLKQNLLNLNLDYDFNKVIIQLINHEDFVDKRFVELINVLSDMDFTYDIAVKADVYGYKQQINRLRNFSDMFTQVRCNPDSIILDYIRFMKPGKGFKELRCMSKKVNTVIDAYKLEFPLYGFGACIKRVPNAFNYGQFPWSMNVDFFMPMLYTQSYGIEMEDSRKWFKEQTFWLRLYSLFKKKVIPIIQGYYDQSENPAGQYKVNAFRVVYEMFKLKECSVYRYSTFVKMLKTSQENDKPLNFNSQE